MTAPAAVRVAVLGGGVAGLSAAHELVERGFQVSVYELDPVAGGKAKSVSVPHTATGGRKDLPGEHGFRFFPGFYRHIIDTMERIPFGAQPRGVAGNLVAAKRIQIEFSGARVAVFPARAPRSVTDFTTLLKGWIDFWLGSGLSKDDIGFYVGKVWQLLTSCDARRSTEYEKIPWWTFIGAETRSPTYKALLGRGMTRALVAAQPEEASTKTIGDVLLQMLFNVAEVGVDADRVLNGPSNEVWIDPWIEHLGHRGVQVHRDAAVTGLRCRGRRITAATVRLAGTPREVEADYFVAAVPVEVMAGLLNEDILATAPSLAGIRELAADVGWMTGILFYLHEPIGLEHGHQLYLEAPWALTSLSQPQFWSQDLSQHYGDGSIREIVSAILCDWHQPGLTTAKPAIDCTADEIAREVWHQLGEALRPTFKVPDSFQRFYLDEAVIFGNPPGQSTTVNRSPLLVNKAGRRHLRPNATTRIENLMLASDYVLTNTDLATMEGANEAARAAVNGIIRASGVSARLCRIWKLNEPEVFAPLRAFDAIRFALGRPWAGAPPLL